MQELSHFQLCFSLLKMRVFLILPNRLLVFGWSDGFGYLFNDLRVVLEIRLYRVFSESDVLFDVVDGVILI